MKTAGKSVLKVLLSFTIAISCLIGISMTSLAVDATISDFEYDGVYKDGDVIRITAEEYAIKSGPNTTSFVHKGDYLTVSTKVDEQGFGVYVFIVDRAGGAGQFEIELENAKCSLLTDGIILASGDGKSMDTAFVFESHRNLDDEQKAVQDMIDALPGVDEVTEEDRADIEAAREAYEALTDEQKEDVYINHLLEVEEQIDKNKAAEVIDLIDAIGEVELTDACIAKINAALDAYRALTDKQQSYVENADDMYAAEDKYYSMLRESVQKKVLDKINALPAADKLTIANYYDVYDAAYEFNEILTEKEQAGFDADAKKKLDEAVTTMFSLAYEAGQQMLDDYGDILKTIIDDDTSEYDWFKELLEEYEPLVASGKTPDFHDFDVLQAFDNTFFSFEYAGSKIYIDGELTDSKFITAEEGSVIITIMPEFLKTLSTGEHTISVLFDNDVTVTSKFTIKPAASVPASGESVSHYVILGISAVLLAGAVLTLRKHMVDSVK